MGKRNPRAENIKQKKLAVFFIIILVAFAFLSIRLYIINRDNGERYKKQVLSQQSYDSIVLPAKRGEIVDRNGTKMAVSQKVYNVVIDAKTLNSNDGVYIEPTISALFNSDIQFNYTRNELRNYILDNPGSQYRIIAKKQSYDVITGIMDMVNNPKDYPDFKGVWLEDTYQRQYPYNTLACDVIGFVQGDNEGAYGLEEYYNNILVGTNGREYGYLNSDENLERTIKPAEDGRTLVTSIDVNIQSIVEKHILAFNEEHRDEAREGNGSSNTGVIIMNPNNGEILAMASYPVYDLNNPRDTSNLDIEVELDPAMYGMGTVLLEGDENETNDESSDNGNTEDGQGALFNMQDNSEPTTMAPVGRTLTTPAGFGADGTKPNTDELTDAEIMALESALSSDDSIKQYLEEQNVPKTYAEAYEEAYEKAKTEKLNSLWKNFCINSTDEPGSTMKCFTMATGLEEGVLTGNESYTCNGVLEVGDHKIHCSNRFGHGDLTFSGALEQSCNIAFMKIGSAIGKSMFMKYNKIFNFGLKTNVDLTGEALTNSLVFDVNSMTPTDLAISSFGQGFNVTMIQLASGFCSLINGGYYYRPHIVTKILDSAGATVETIEPRIIKQTVSEDTSDKIKQLCINVVDIGTGKSARPAGYRIGGKTGTAEKYPRGTENYVVSFISFAPADDPQIMCYVVIDEPNVAQQASSKYATLLCRDILTEVLPYMNIFRTEELSEEEKAELAEKQLDFSEGAATTQEEPAEVTIEAESGETQSSESDESNGEGAEESGNSAITFVDEEETVRPQFEKDPETGYLIDPTSGVLLDPNTGAPVDGSISNLE